MRRLAAGFQQDHAGSETAQLSSSAEAEPKERELGTMGFSLRLQLSGIAGGRYRVEQLTVLGGV